MYVFIVGAPRSGTTILEEVLGRHPDVAHFYEPYFIWDYLTGYLDDDVREERHATDATRNFVRREFALFLRKSRRRVLVEKTPENSFRIPFILSIFPEARFIHIVRDGRDVTASIAKEWAKRGEIVRQRDWRSFLEVLRVMLELQPFWRNRLQAVWFELKNMRGFSSRKFLNKAKWDGMPGWGPRFPGWREARARLSELQFCALQWVQSVEAVRMQLSGLEPGRWVEIRYEDLLRNPRIVLESIFRFIGLERPLEPRFSESLLSDNSGKWRSLWSPAERQEMGAILHRPLLELGYVSNESWYQSISAVS